MDLDTILTVFFLGLTAICGIALLMMERKGL